MKITSRIAVLVGTIILTLVWPSVSPLAAQRSLSATEIYARVVPSIVFIETDTSSGTGFVVSSEGLIATAWHVIEDAKFVRITLESGDVFDRVDLLAADMLRDIALIRIPGFELPSVVLGNSQEVQPGNPVFVIGNPLGFEELRASISDGLVSGRRVIEGIGTVFQHTAPAYPGSSGGPMLASNGTVVGIVSFRVPEEESLNFAVPINSLRGLMEFDRGEVLQSWESEEARRVAVERAAWEAEEKRAAEEAAREARAKRAAEEAARERVAAEARRRAEVAAQIEAEEERARIAAEIALAKRIAASPPLEGHWSSSNEAYYATSLQQALAGVLRQDRLTRSFSQRREMEILRDYQPRIPEVRYINVGMSLFNRIKAGGAGLIGQLHQITGNVSPLDDVSEFRQQLSDVASSERYDFWNGRINPHRDEGLANIGTIVPGTLTLEWPCNCASVPLQDQLQCRQENWGSQIFETTLEVLSATQIRILSVIPLLDGSLSAFVDVPSSTSATCPVRLLPRPLSYETRVEIWTKMSGR